MRITSSVTFPIGFVVADKYALLLGPVFTGLAYYFGAKLGATASIMSEGISIFWPPNAFLLAALMLSPPRYWILYLLAAIPAEIAADLPIFSLQQALLFVTVNIFETLLAACLFKVTVGLPVKLDCLRHIALFGLFALVIASGISALLGAALYSSATVNAGSFQSNWRIWWFGDGLGLLIITPPLLGWLQKQSSVWDAPSVNRRWEVLILLAVTFLLGSWIFSLPEYLTDRYPASPSLMVPVTLWAATRFGVRGAASINLVIAVIAISATLGQRGPFISMRQTDNVLRLQEYLFALSFSSLALAALLQEMRVQNTRLRALDRAIQTVHAGILITDATTDNSIIYANKGFETITGYKVEEVLGKSPRFLHDAGIDPIHAQVLKKAIKQRQRIQATLQNRRKDGVLFYNQIVIDPVRDDKGDIRHFIGVQHDVSELIEKENALFVAHLQLEEINRDLEKRIEERTQELRLANEKLAALAATDALTTAYNRRHFMELANDEFARSLRYERQLSVIAIDIDHFKHINDRFGHDAGDRVLLRLTETARETLRPSDIFARFGGEEFCVLLPETGVDEAMLVAGRLQSAISQQCIDSDQGQPINFCVSMGVAALCDDDANIETILKRADHALYAAKDAGRNCIRSG